VLKIRGAKAFECLLARASLATHLFAACRAQVISDQISIVVTDNIYSHAISDSQHPIPDKNVLSYTLTDPSAQYLGTMRHNMFRGMPTALASLH
jgi:hypothetical protein